MLLRKLLTIYYFLNYIFEFICKNWHYVPTYTRILALAITFRYIWICLCITYRINKRYFLIIKFVLKGRRYTISTIKHAWKTNSRFYKRVIFQGLVRIQDFITTKLVNFLNMGYKAMGVLYFIIALLTGIIYSTILITLNNKVEIDKLNIEVYNILSTLNIFILIFFFLLPVLLGCISYFIIPLLSKTPKLNFLSLILIVLSFLCFTYSIFSIWGYEEILCFTLPRYIHNPKTMLFFYFISLIINSISILLYFINLINISLNKNSLLKFKYIFKFFCFVLLLLFFFLCSLLIFLGTFILILKNYKLGSLEGIFMNINQEFENILRYNSIILIIICIIILLYNLTTIFYRKSIKLGIIFIFFLICSFYELNLIMSMKLESDFNIAKIIIFIILWLSLLFFNFGDIIKYISLFIFSSGFFFFLIFYGIYDESKSLYYVLLIISLSILHYWTYEILPKLANISRERLYICYFLIILLGLFFIIHSSFLNLLVERSFTEFLKIYGSFLIFYKTINLILLIIPKMLTKRYLFIFPWTKKQKIYEELEDIHKYHMYEWFLGFEVREEMFPFYEEMAALQEDELEFDPVDYYFDPVTIKDLDEEIIDDANCEFFIVTIDEIEAVIKSGAERYGDMKWYHWSKEELHIIHRYETDSEDEI